VVEAPVTLQRVRSRPTQRQLELVVHRLDSHPIGQELGILSQRAELALEVELDMVVEDGREVARSAIAAPGSGPGEPLGPRPETDGQGNFVEYALRWGLRELGEPVLRSLGRLWRR
jgi:hypothetical protein